MIAIKDTDDLRAAVEIGCDQAGVAQADAEVRVASLTAARR